MSPLKSSRNIAFIVDPLPKLKLEKDSTIAMMAAAAARGHRIFACEQGQISLSEGRVVGDFMELTLTGEAPRWYRAGPPAECALADFGAVLMRKDPPFDMEYVYSTYLLEHAARQGATVVNDPRAVRDNNEKYSITEFPSLTTEVLVTRDPVRLRAFVARHEEAVLKLLDVHIMILNDPALIDAACGMVASDLVNAEWAIAEKAEELAAQFREIDDPYLKERGRDVEQVTSRLLKALAGSRLEVRRRDPGEPLIIVAHDITPADILDVEADDDLPAVIAYRLDVRQA